MSELGAGTRGSSLGFSALEMAQHKFGKHFFNKYDKVVATTYNEALYAEDRTPFAKNIDAIFKSAEGSADLISGVISENEFPFVISGDHCNAASTIAAIKKSHPDKRLGVIWVDAHGDLHSPYTSPSGNMHGMPLAISIADDNLESKKNDPDELSVGLWNELKNLGGISPKIDPKDIVFFGVRDTEAPEDHLMEKHGMRNFKVEEVRHNGIEKCLTEAKRILKDCDLIYISFDVDSMDPNLVSHGTGTPVDNGFSPDEVFEIMAAFIQDERLICFETVEINPLLDEKKNMMAETTVRILDNLMRKYEKA